MTRWFEDITIDEDFPLGSHTFSAEEIIRFATLYDPQYFHVDPELAKQSHFGGLIASGWHTVSVGHRKMVDALFAEEDRLRGLGQEPGVSGPSPGVNSMEFKAPVRPGDTVTYTLTVTGKRASNSIPGWGLLFNRLVAINQHGEMVYKSDLVGFSKLRDYQMPAKLRVLLALTKVPVLGKLISRRS
ncbi:MaoC family dehydratase [Devosia sp. XJ19-1]|uniref:MaoC family dehydratase n=1 Tax=Devosia ureilytica TaxID=2952754 RepID=A0A9Q4APM1_9HYPH|nr:MaoC family dehydratase [Devosia ureilytica]MCP8883917.1 MaoC family dehydratase [Devosia ureilytica]MCP8887525.1 MaoC family dehydratase [Devosia ureilytica]